ncbi:hypothetical protein [Streptomyces asiaticus]
MRPDDWQLTEDIDGFLARAGNFMCSRPALHNTPLTDIEKLRTRGADAHGNEVTVFGRLESGGDIRAIFYRTPAVVRPSHPSLPRRPACVHLALAAGTDRRGSRRSRQGLRRNKSVI